MVRNTFIKITFSVLLLFSFLIIISCSKYKEQPLSIDENQLQQEQQSPIQQQLEIPKFNDPAYKLFFGEWKIRKVVGTNERFPDDPDAVQGEIGKKIIYLENKVILDGKVIIENPNYSIAIIPVHDPHMQYIEYMPPLDEIGIKGDYFVFVDVLDNSGNYVTDIGTLFYIKDDNTLIIFNDGGTYFEMTRIAHIKDAELGEKYF